MPRGSRHDETGTIWREAGHLVLLRDAAGRWRLDAPLSAERLFGKRARVVGTRSGFDLLDVHSIELTT